MECIEKWGGDDWHLGLDASGVMSKREVYPARHVVLHALLCTRVNSLPSKSNHNRKQPDQILIRGN